MPLQQAKHVSQQNANHDAVRDSPARGHGASLEPAHPLLHAHPLHQQNGFWVCRVSRPIRMVRFNKVWPSLTTRTRIHVLSLTHTHTHSHTHTHKHTCRCEAPNQSSNSSQVSTKLSSTDEWQRTATKTRATQRIFELQRSLAHSN